MKRRVQDFPCGSSAAENVRLTSESARLSEELAEAKAHIHSLIELNPQIVFITDAEGQLCEIADTWLHWAGVSLEEALGLGWMSALHPDDVEPTLSAWKRCLRTGEQLDIEYRLRMAAGPYVWFRARALPRRDSHGNIIRWYGAAEDIHERKSIDTALRASEAFSRSILTSSRDAIMVIDHEGRLEFINDGGLASFDIAVLGDVKDKPWGDLWPEATQVALAQALAEADAGQPTRFATYRDRRGGERTWWDVSVSKFETRDVGPPKVLAIARDVTEAKLAEETLERAASTDPLTQLANRIVFRETVATALARRQQAVVLFIDLDQFKAVNDLLGHLSGDELLRQAASRLRECVRAEDLVARLGGDEFAVFLRAATVEIGQLMSARMIERLGAAFSLEGRVVTISACIGITRLEGVNVDEVLKRADIALYSAKMSQSGTYRVFEEEMGRAVEERQSLLLDLRGALSRGEFILEYQGLLQTGSSQFSTFEALLRWQHPVHGRISPETFVPLLEESGAITSVGAWVLDEACRRAAAWPGQANVAVNLSPVQFRVGDLIEQVSRSIARSGLEPHRLQLEMTESILLENSEANLRALEALRELGVAIVLDDFGTGYSSLSYLRRFRFDKIKIDRSFIADVLWDGSATAIVAAIVDLATRLGIPTTAEGIENHEQYCQLVRLGCREFQGYLFSRPVTAERLTFALS